jgi:hypothetical protein
MTSKYLFPNCKETFLLRYAKRTWFVMSKLPSYVFIMLTKLSLTLCMLFLLPLIRYNIIYVRC